VLRGDHQGSHQRGFGRGQELHPDHCEQVLT
jgi:hypothetical protein